MSFAAIKEVLLASLLLIHATSATASLCSAQEQTLFHCASGGREYSVCASGVLSKSTGYIEYRSAENGAIGFTYPAARSIPPAKAFQFVLLAKGARFSFMSEDTSFELSEQVVGLPSMLVTKQGKSTSIECGEHTEGLILTSTQRVLKEAGVSE